MISGKFIERLPGPRDPNDYAPVGSQWRKPGETDVWTVSVLMFQAGASPWVALLCSRGKFNEPGGETLDDLLANYERVDR